MADSLETTSAIDLVERVIDRAKAHQVAIEYGDNTAKQDAFGELERAKAEAADTITRLQAQVTAATKLVECIKVHRASVLQGMTRNEEYALTEAMHGWIVAGVTP